MIKTTGINHVALVCRDMQETVAFYTEVLNMPLFKTVELPGGGQHFFFDCGNGTSVAFFWWEDGPEAAPGIADQMCETVIGDRIAPVLQDEAGIPRR